MRFFFLLFIYFFVSCNQGNTSSNPVANISSEDTTPKIDSDNATKEAAQVDSLVLLLDELKKVPLKSEKWKVFGDLKTAELTFKEVAFGDLLHLIFTYDNGEEHDFSDNASDVALFKEATDETDDDGIVANKKYLNKKFRVVWRHLKLVGEPKDEMDMYYQEYDQIIYLKQL